MFVTFFPCDLQFPSVEASLPAQSRHDSHKSLYLGIEYILETAEELCYNQASHVYCLAHKLGKVEAGHNRSKPDSLPKPEGATTTSTTTTNFNLDQDPTPSGTCKWPPKGRNLYLGGFCWAKATPLAMFFLRSAMQVSSIFSSMASTLPTGRIFSTPLGPSSTRLLKKSTPWSL